MSDFRAGFVGLIGEPNAGKSTLMNFLVQEKVSIVTPKPQTTRRRIHGIHTQQEGAAQGQIVFVDSPGLIHAKEGLNAFLEYEALEVIRESDVLIAVLSVDTEKKETLEEILNLIIKSKKPWFAVITKADLRDKGHRVLILKEMLNNLGAKHFTLSMKDAEYQEARQDILDHAISLLPVTERPLYEDDIFTTETLRQLACEIVREKCFEFCHQEIPYNMAVRSILFDEHSKKVPHVSLEILVAKENHKGMVIGKGGENLKKIGSEARKGIEKIMGEKIFLDIKVTCRENWYKNLHIMKELGYFHEKNRTKNK